MYKLVVEEGPADGGFAAKFHVHFGHISNKSIKNERKKLTDVITKSEWKIR